MSLTLIVIFSIIRELYFRSSFLHHQSATPQYYMLLFDLQSLKETMYRVVPEKQKEVAEFRKEYGDKSLGEYTVDQVYFTHCILCHDFDKLRHIFFVIFVTLVPLDYRF